MTTLIAFSIGGALLLSVIFPVHIPIGILNTIDIFANAIWKWEGIVPISSWLNDIHYIFYISLIYAVFRIVVGIVALATGGGKPDA